MIFALYHVCKICPHDDQMVAAGPACFSNILSARKVTVVNDGWGVGPTRERRALFALLVQENGKK